MDIELNEEDQAIRELAAEFISRECPPEEARRLDDAAEFPRVLWDKMAKAGFMRGVVPEEYGGDGLSVLQECLIIEEFAKALFAAGMMYMATSFSGPRPVANLGTEEQKQRFLPAMADGETMFGIALTETGSGTDLLGSLRMTARRDGDRYILNGQKLYTSNADQCDYILTLARTAPPGDRKGYGLTLFIVPQDHPGLDIRRLDKLGGRSISTCEVFYDDVDVQAVDILGTENEGFYQLLGTLNHERITTAVMALAIGEAALAEMIAYAKDRKAFGRPIGQFQAIQHKIADSVIDLGLARLAIYRAADRLDRGLDLKVDATAAKLVATEASFRVATRGMDVMSGMAFVRGGTMERCFRDIRQLMLGPVTNDMARNIIGESVGLPRSY